MCIEELAKRTGKSVKDLCLEASKTTGPQAYLDYVKYGTAPNWLIAWSNDQLLGSKPLQAQSLSVGLFGQGVVDNESDAMPQA